MKHYISLSIRIIFATLCFVAVVNLVSIQAHATPKLTVLHNFSAGSFNDNSDGEYPAAALVEDKDGAFYGTTSTGGANGTGTIFTITRDGKLTTIYNFSNVSSQYVNRDGAYPVTSLVRGSNGDFYGAASSGGLAGTGVLFKISPRGTLTTLYDFTVKDANGFNADGANPDATLVQGRDGDFYGTTSVGGVNGEGTIYKISPSGAFTHLQSFVADDPNGAGASKLVEDWNGNLYGTTVAGGTFGAGTVFKITRTGAFSTIFNFDGTDGQSPAGGLVEGWNSRLYGTTIYGGMFGSGSIFEITPSGKFTTLHNFSSPDYNNHDGSNPISGLILGHDGNLYGTTEDGGAMGWGTFFRMGEFGDFETMYDFAPGDGEYANGLVQGKRGNFFGTAARGGSDDNGTVFVLTDVNL